jgi:hypothetical protein
MLGADPQAGNGQPTDPAARHTSEWRPRHALSPVGQLLTYRAVQQ